MSLNLEFEGASRLLGRLAAPFLDEVADSMVDAFTPTGRAAASFTAGGLGPAEAGGRPVAAAICLHRSGYLSRFAFRRTRRKNPFSGGRGGTRITLAASGSGVTASAGRTSP